MVRVCAVVFATVAAALLALAPAAAAPPKWFAKAVKKVEAKFTPAEAKPGQTVTFTLTVELHEGYHTYPTAQPDKLAAGMVNVLKFPAPAAVIFVGSTEDSKNFVTKEEPDLGIKELRVNVGTATYARKAVVSPKAPVGEAKVKLDAFELSVCDKSNCFPPEKVPVEAVLKVLDGPAVPVEPAFAAEVTKALTGK